MDMHTIKPLMIFGLLWGFMVPAVVEDWKRLMEDLANSDRQVELQAGERTDKVVLPWLQSLDTASLKAEVAQIAPLCDDPRPAVRFKAVALITTLAMVRTDSAAVIEPAVPTLLRRFSDSDPKLKNNAVMTIMDLRPAPPAEAFPALRDLLSDPEIRAVGSASKGLMRISLTVPAAEEAVQQFLNQEKRPDRLVPALYGIGQARIASEATVACVAGFLRHRDDRVASAATDALQELGGKAASALPALEAVIADPDIPPERQAMAKTAIGVISRRAAAGK